MDPNSLLIQSDKFVTHVLLVDEVASLTIWIAVVPEYTLTILVLAEGAVAGIKSLFTQRVSPRISNGLALASLLALFMAEVSVLATPKPTFFHK